MFGFLFGGHLRSYRAPSAEIGDLLVQYAARCLQAAQVSRILAVDLRVLPQLSGYLAAKATGVGQRVCLSDGAYELLEAPLVIAGCELGELYVLGYLGRGGRLLVEGGSHLADCLALL